METKKTLREVEKKLKALKSDPAGNFSKIKKLSDKLTALLSKLPHSELEHSEAFGEIQRLNAEIEEVLFVF